MGIICSLVTAAATLIFKSIQLEQTRYIYTILTGVSSVTEFRTNNLRPYTNSSHLYFLPRGQKRIRD